MSIFNKLGIAKKVVFLFLVMLLSVVLNGLVCVVFSPANSQAGNNIDPKLLVIIITAASTIVGSLISILIIISIKRPIKTMTNFLEDAVNENGDFTKRLNITGNNEIAGMAKLFNQFIEKLHKMICNINEVVQINTVSSKELSVSSSESSKALEQISQAITNIANGASENAILVKETTDGLHETVKFSEITMQNSKKTAQDSEKVKQSAQDGVSEIDNVISSMDTIKQSSHQITSVIKELETSSEKIGSIVQVITSISEQTNMLALNAAIEAARAGESGKGFNVVASEIRKLADESNQAAKNIIALIQDNRTKSEAAVKFTEKAENEIAAGIQLVINIGNHMKNIIAEIENIVSSINEIDESVSQQTAIVNEMYYAMDAISTTSTDTASSTEQISASVQEQLSIMEELETMSSHLADICGRLNALSSEFRI